MDEKDPVDAYMATSSRERRLESERLEHSLDQWRFFQLAKRAVEAKHAQLASAQATHFTLLEPYHFKGEFEFRFATENDNGPKAVSFRRRVDGWNWKSPFEMLVLRSAVKRIGLTKVADKVAGSVLEGLARHEALLVARGSLDAPAGWSALEERAALGGQAPDPLSPSRRSSSL